MKTRRFTLGLLAVCILLLMEGCSRGSDAQPSSFDNHGIYYWRTTFAPDSTELAFIRQQNIRRIYLRYFDVSMDTRRNEITPVGTCVFKGQKPQGVEIIPTIFIMENCLWHQQPADLAGKLVRRIIQMSETNDIQDVHEIQIDCDYTLRSRQRYYTLLGEIRKELRRHGMRLSTTIRLHQLNMPAPPADYGVLMLYNTGDVTRRNGHNPILDMRDVRPYLRYLSSYQLPLVAAYPLFEWRVLFHDQQFRHIVYSPADAQCKLVGDTVLHWQCTPDDLSAVKRAVGKKRPELNRGIILYHLDHQLINKYTEKDYEKIFAH